MRGKGFLVIILLFGATAWAHADDFADAMRSYERQEYRQALQQFQIIAGTGDADAQYMLGRMYEAGTGTLQDFVQAHVWYNLAAAGGHRHAAGARDAVAARMTASQIAEAQAQARTWSPAAAAPTPVPAAPGPAPLTGRELVAGVQRELNRLGYDAGPVDGLMGARTRNAIRSYQASVGLPQDGQPTAALLQRLERHAPVAAAPTPTPPAQATVRVALQDDFGDGDFRRNPPWTVLSGDFQVDSGGLRTVVQPPREVPQQAGRPGRAEEIGLAVLQLIMEQTGRGPGAAQPGVPMAEPARIFVRAPVGNAFDLELELASYQRPGSLELGMYQGDQPDDGYRLVYNAGSSPGLSLVRLGAGGGEVLATSDGAVDLEDGRTHTLSWVRSPGGIMQVRVNGRRVLHVQDRTLERGFQGFVLVNHEGDYNLRRIRIEG